MKKFYFPVQIILCFGIFFSSIAKSQNCALLSASYTTYESRCAATGSIKIIATRGSGNYKYKMTGPVNSNYTSTDSITGLSAGTYTLYVNDVANNCTITKINVVVNGTYQDPRFTLTKVDVSCDNGSNGSITVAGQQFGRPPFGYSIAAPSPMGVGTTNGTGVFTGLSAGNYSIRMTDSCGGIQTRQITIGNYTWWIDSYPFTKIGCDTATGFIKVIDSRGNISTVGGIPGITYGIVRSPGDTLWSSNPNFTFPLLGSSTFEVIAKDACGTIKKAPVSVFLQPTLGTVVNTYNFTCNSFSAGVTSVANFLGANFCLLDSNSVQISCNTTGIFINLPYGRYCIVAKDSCTDTTIKRCFSAVPPPLSVGNKAVISNKTCTGFTASITGQVGLINPNYCLYDSVNTLITCNSTGVFNLLSFGRYCIKTTDGCRDTTFTTCFAVRRPTPTIYPIVPSYITCTNFGIITGGDTLTNPLYCLYDSAGVLITCNNTGVFDSLSFGKYCVKARDMCYDTTITRCFNVPLPIINNDVTYRIFNKTCTSFSVRLRGASLVNPTYCLYTAADILITCNSTGVFNNLLYGSYCVWVQNGCPDTTFKVCFTAGRPLPSVAATVFTSNNTCTNFWATVTGQKNLTNPSYCIYNSSNVLLSCNTTGVFTNLDYGSYCIKITNTCFDTTIIRCFTKAPTPVSISGSSRISCSIGYAKFNLNMGGGVLPVNIKIYSTNGSLFSDSNYYSNIVIIDSIPALAVGQTYKIIARDNCGNIDSLRLGATASYFKHVPVVATKCPGGSWANGSGNIETNVTTNLGALTIRIIKKDGILYTPALTPNSVVANIYTYIDLGPGIYIMSANENNCNNTLYDTVIINPYQYPNLSRSSAYQCDVAGFSVSAIAANGVGPFSYEIIGSVPTTPSIIAAPQTSPYFNINNGANYSLIRLRALDACGNATLGDASILPLAINRITTTANCLFSPATLTVDPVFNATYSWYKYNTASTDSTLIGEGSSIFISALLPSDTGIYVCHFSIKPGCVNHTYLYHLSGNCGYIILPVTLVEFTGTNINEDNLLQWKTSQEHNLLNFIVERKNGNNYFSELGKVSAAGNSSSSQQYQYSDQLPPIGKNYYRLKMQDRDHAYHYSNTVVLKNNKKTSFNIYPNPATEKITLDFGVSKKQHYKITLLNTLSQVIKETVFITDAGKKLQITRAAGMNKGMYILRITDLDTNEIFTKKIIFL